VETIDGVKLWYGDGSWILIRPSGTEPIFRLYAESSTQEKVDHLVERHRELVASTVERLK
jgi:phosphomannomutase/phosphoglucomutase